MLLYPDIKERRLNSEIRRKKISDNFYYRQLKRNNKDKKIILKAPDKEM